jgi:integrase
MAKRDKNPKGGSRNRGKRGEGSIYPEPNGTFRVQVWIDGKLVRRSAADRTQAEAIRQELIKLRDSGTEALQGLQSVDDFVAYWFKEVYLQRDVKPRSAEHTLAMLDLHILPAIGTKALSSVTHAHLQKLLNDMRRRRAPLKPLSAQTVRHAHSVIKQVFGKAKAMNLITLDPSDDLEVPKVKRAARPALTIPQVRALLAVVDSADAGARLAPAFHLMATLGLRIGEALGVRREDFSADFDTLTIAQQIDYHSNMAADPKSEASGRTLPVPPRLAAKMARQWAITCSGKDRAPALESVGLLFPTASGGPTFPRNFERLWGGQTTRRQRAKGLTEVHYPGFRDLAQLPAGTTLHDLRRFVATTLEDLDVGQRTIGHILGHEAGNVTEGYIKRNLPTLRRALEKLEAALWGEPQEGEKPE